MKLMPERLPAEIEAQSFAIIDNHFGNPKPFTGPAWEIARRVIHAAGDVTLAGSLHLPDAAIAAGIQALAAGAPVFTDTMMVKAGITPAKLPRNNQVRCILEAPNLAETAQAEQCTRSRAGVLHFADEFNDAVVVVGNAPTALLALLDLYRDKGVRPALVVGMPVGFINAEESKELLLAETGLPALILRGPRGGSPLAAAALNALALLAGKTQAFRAS